MDRIFNKQLLTVISILFSLTFTAFSEDQNRTTIAGWTFPKAPALPNQIPAECGTMQSVSAIITDGTCGSTNTEMVFASSSGSATANGLCGSDESNNGAIGLFSDISLKYVVFELSTKGYFNLKLSFDEQSYAGYSLFGFGYSLDGGNSYKDITTVQGIASTEEFSQVEVDFSKIVELENQPVIYIRISLSNPETLEGGANIFDNFNFTAVRASVFCNETFIGFGNSTSVTIERTFKLTSSGSNIPALNLTTSGAFTLSNDGTNFSNSITTTANATSPLTIHVKYNPIGVKGMTFNTIKISGATLNSNTIPLTAINAPFYESFDNPSVGNSAAKYPMIDVNYTTGTWKVARNVMNPVFDRYVGNSGVRLRYPLTIAKGEPDNGLGDNGVQMMFDKNNGAGMINFLYSTFGTYPGGGSLKVEYSIDKGVTWKTVNTVTSIPAWNGHMYVGTAIINHVGDIDGRIRIRIMKMQSGNNSPINIDDVSITDYVIPTVIANPSSVNFGNVYTGDTHTIELNLFIKGLESDLKLISNSPYFTVDEPSIQKSFVGNKTVTITFKPTAVATYSGNLTLSSSKINQNIKISGYGTNGDKIAVTYAFNDVANTTQKTSVATTIAPTVSDLFFSQFSAEGALVGNNKIGAFDVGTPHFYFNTWPTGSSYDSDTYYEFSVNGDADGDLDDLISLSSLSFDVIVQGSATYKVACSVDDGSFIDMPATLTRESQYIKTNGNEFKISGVTPANKISGSKIVFSGANYTDNHKYTFRFYAHGNTKFGVDNVTLNLLMRSRENPSITLTGVEDLVTFNKKGTTVTPISQTIEVVVDGTLTDDISISILPVNEGFSYTLTDWGNKTGGKIKIEYNNPNSGDHKAILNINSGTISHSVNLSGITTPEEYVFIGGNPGNPTSWLEPTNWEGGDKPADDDINSKIKIEAPVILVGLKAISCGEIKIVAGGSLSLTHNANIKINSSIYEDGKSRVESAGLVNIINDELNSGTILFGSSVNPPRTKITQRTLTMGDGGLGSLYQFISSPIGAISNSYIRKYFDGAFLDRFNESKNTWERFGELGEGWSENKDEGIEANRGYSINFENPQDVIFDGYLAAPADVTYSTTHTATGAAGYNLIGNPFSGSIDLTTMGTWPSFMANYNDCVYLWNRDGNYEVVTSEIQNGAGVIPMGQAFWVIQKNSGSATFKIPYSAVGTRNPNQPLMKSSIYERDHVILSISGDNLSDKFQLYEISDCSNAYDESFDAYKWMGNENAPQLYSVVDNNMFSIDSRSDISVTNLNLIAGSAAMYTITAEYKIGDRGLYLVDNKTGYIHNFDNGSISLPASKSDDVNRFKLVVGNDPKSVKDNVVMPNVKIWSYGKNVYIVGETGNAIIYDIQGRIVAKTIIDGGQKMISIDKPGLYIVKANGITRKIVIL